ncbi:MAG: D-glycero-beta-D-manno-heptose 1-phosphate adenylyltransferase [Pyrinomonadaceae bacterium]
MSILVFTNGCFDLIHPGHIDLLERARALGDRLVVGLNSDASVRAIRGEGRPFVSQEDRAAVLRGLRSVDEVVIFDEPTPARLIAELQPDVLVKGGDWAIDRIVGAQTVLGRGGQVRSLPLKPGYSTTSIVEKIQGMSATAASRAASDDDARPDADDAAALSLREHQSVISAILSGGLETIRQAGAEIHRALSRGHKLLLCGNGGSASDAQHIAAEFVGRFEDERRALPAIALTTDTSALTALANDYGYARIFARQVDALANSGDVLICISTSGNSDNVLAAAMAARERGCRTIGLTGANGKRLASLCDVTVLVPSTRTARIQEAHIAIGHIWCEMVDALFRVNSE